MQNFTLYINLQIKTESSMSRVVVFFLLISNLFELGYLFKNSLLGSNIDETCGSSHRLNDIFSLLLQTTSLITLYFYSYEYLKFLITFLSFKGNVI